MHQSNSKLSKEYADLKEHYEKLVLQSTPKSKTQDSATLKQTLKNPDQSRKVLKSFEKDIQLLEKRLSVPTDVSNEYKLEVQVRQMQKLLDNLKKENERLNKVTLQLVNPQEIIPNPEIELQKELMQLNRALQKVEVLVDKNSKITEEYKSKIPTMETKANELKIKLGQYKEINNDKRKFLDDLNKKLIVTSNSWKANVTKYQQKIKDMEAEENDIREKEIGIRTKVFKKAQQMRLLHMTHDELISMRGSQDKQDEGMFHPDVNFLFKPSVNALYI